MPNIKSAKKRVLVIRKKNLENRMIRTQMNNAIKKFNNAIDTLNLEEADKLLPATMSTIDKAVSKGVIHKNQAANKKSALSKRLSDVKSGKLVISIKKDNKTIAAEKARAAQEARAAIKAENARKAAERQAAKIEAEKAKAEAEKPVKKTKEKAPKAEKAEKVEKTEKKAPAKKTTKKKEEPAKEAAPATEEPKAE
ncbi:MAG: 30S ribosomal protein S20 [Clostridia bacterium]|nr:30S ribosomal protein S20 [Clostridia bacterium]